MKNTHFRMRPKYRESIPSQIFQIGHKLGHPSLYCEIRHFACHVVTWEKRKALRKKLVQSLKRITKLNQKPWNKLPAKRVAGCRSVLSAVALNQVSATRQWNKLPAKRVAGCRSVLSAVALNQVSATRQWNELLKPGARPVHSQAVMSIAHCPFMGGFVFSFNTDISLGLDIEIADRVSDKVIHRIATAEEVQQAPSKALLWTAKEASFKCLGVDKTSILPIYCDIYDWIGWKSAYLFSFSYKGQKGRGGGFRVDQLAFAYAQLLLNQTGFEKGATLEDFSSYKVDKKQENSNQTSIK